MPEVAQAPLRYADSSSEISVSKGVESKPSPERGAAQSGIGETAVEEVSTGTTEGRNNEEVADEHHEPRTKSFAFRRNPEPQLSGNARKIYDDLIGNAKAGDAAAAYELTRVLSACRTRPQFPATEERAYIEPHPGLECGGLGDAEFEGIVELLRLAAHGGVIEAQIDFLPVASVPFEDAQYLASHIPEFQRYRDDAIGFLNRAAMRGSVDAMVSLSNQYDGGVLVGRDPVYAYAYAWAAQQSGLVGATFHNHVDGLEAQLTPEQRARALQMGNEIRRRCCG